MLRQKSCTILIIPVLIGMVLFMSSCSIAVPSPAPSQPNTTPQTPDLPENRSPVIYSMGAENEVSPSGSARILCVASDEDNDTLNYAWSCDQGAIAGTGYIVTWHAPAKLGVYDINVKVTDGKGGEAVDSVAVTVVTQPDMPVNRQPLAILIVSEVGKPDIAAVPPLGVRIIVQGCNSYEIECIAYDPDGDPLTCEWNTSIGKVEGSGYKVRYRACQPGLFVVTATVTDTRGRYEKIPVYFEVPSRQ